MIAFIRSFSSLRIRPPRTRVKTLGIAWIMAATCWPLMAWTENPSQRPVAKTDATVLTLEDALRLARNYNPQLQAASAQVAGAEAGIRTAQAYPNPQFNNLTGYQYVVRNRVGPAVPGLLQHYSFDQPLELPSLRKARIAAATEGRTGSDFGLTEMRVAVRASVKQAYYEVLRREEEVALAEENLRTVNDLLRRVRIQVEVGEAARLELTRAEAELATARTFVRAGQVRLANAIAMLSSLIGTPLGPDVDVVMPPKSTQPVPTLEALRAEMLERYPALKQSEARIRQADSLVQLQLAMRKPQPSVRLEYEHQPDLGFLRLGVSLPLPVWNRREGPIGEAVAARTEAAANAEAVRLQLLAQLDRAFSLYEIASQQIASLEQGSLREAEAALQAAEAALRYGERGILEVLDAQRVLRSVRTDYLAAQFDLQSALIEIEQLRAADLETLP